MNGKNEKNEERKKKLRYLAKGFILGSCFVLCGIAITKKVTNKMPRGIQFRGVPDVKKVQMRIRNEITGKTYMCLGADLQTAKETLAQLQEAVKTVEGI